MEDLKRMACTACRGDEPTLGEDEIKGLMPAVPDWKLVTRDGVPRLEREFHFNDFAQALEFTNKVGELAEKENHHPAILTEYGKVTVWWWTHKIKGLHQNDFIAAAKTDAL